MARRRRRRRGIVDPIVGGILGVVGLVLIAGLAGGAWWVRSRHVPLDVETNCPLAGPTAIHVVIFDRSDPVTGQQAQRVKQTMEDYKEAARFGERFDIYTFEGDSSAALEPILTICSPGRPGNANPLIENPELIRKRYQERFSEVLGPTIDGLLQESTRHHRRPHVIAENLCRCHRPGR